MRAYVDSSVVSRVLLGQPNALTDWMLWEAGYSSALLDVEVARALDRVRIQRQLDAAAVGAAAANYQDIRARLRFSPLSQAVLDRAAAPMPTVIGTLDAIHLATAMILRERLSGAGDLIFATHDAQQAAAARAAGFSVAGLDA